LADFSVLLLSLLPDLLGSFLSAFFGCYLVAGFLTLTSSFFLVVVAALGCYFFPTSGSLEGAPFFTWTEVSPNLAYFVL
jgi:hypothetical protein